MLIEDAAGDVYNRHRDLKKGVYYGSPFPCIVDDLIWSGVDSGQDFYHSPVGRRRFF
jgi:hypothetical protein